MRSNATWWVFDRPLKRERLLSPASSLVCSGFVQTMLQKAKFGGGAFVLTVAFAVPSGVLAAGVFGGSAREYIRGRRSASQSDTIRAGPCARMNS